jgi:hypothetical protein
MSSSPRIPVENTWERPEPDHPLDDQAAQSGRHIRDANYNSEPVGQTGDQRVRTQCVYIKPAEEDGDAPERCKQTVEKSMPLCHWHSVYGAYFKVYRSHLHTFSRGQIRPIGDGVYAVVPGQFNTKTFDPDTMTPVTKKQHIAYLPGEPIGYYADGVDKDSDGVPDHHLLPAGGEPVSLKQLKQRYGGSLLAHVRPRAPTPDDARPYYDIRRVVSAIGLAHDPVLPYTEDLRRVFDQRVLKTVDGVQYVVDFTDERYRMLKAYDQSFVPSINCAFVILDRDGSGPEPPMLLLVAVKPIFDHEELYASTDMSLAPVRPPSSTYATPMVSKDRAWLSAWKTPALDEFANKARLVYPRAMPLQEEINLDPPLPAVIPVDTTSWAAHAERWATFLDEYFDGTNPFSQSGVISIYTAYKPFLMEERIERAIEHMEAAGLMDAGIESRIDEDPLRAPVGDDVAAVDVDFDTATEDEFIGRIQHQQALGENLDNLVDSYIETEDIGREQLERELEILESNPKLTQEQRDEKAVELRRKYDEAFMQLQRYRDEIKPDLEIMTKSNQAMREGIDNWIAADRDNLRTMAELDTRLVEADTTADFINKEAEKLKEKKDALINEYNAVRQNLISMESSLDHITEKVNRDKESVREVDSALADLNRRRTKTIGNMDAESMKLESAEREHREISKQINNEKRRLKRARDSLEDSKVALARRTGELSEGVKSAKVRADEQFAVAFQLLQDLNDQLTDKENTMDIADNAIRLVETSQAHSAARETFEKLKASEQEIRDELVAASDEIESYQVDLSRDPDKDHGENLLKLERKRAALKALESIARTNVRMFRSELTKLEKQIKEMQKKRDYLQRQLDADTGEKEKTRKSARSARSASNAFVANNKEEIQGLQKSLLNAQNGLLKLTTSKRAMENDKSNRSESRDGAIKHIRGELRKIDAMLEDIYRRAGKISQDPAFKSYLGKKFEFPRFDRVEMFADI